MRTSRVQIFNQFLFKQNHFKIGSMPSLACHIRFTRKRLSIVTKLSEKLWSVNLFTYSAWRHFVLSLSNGRTASISTFRKFKCQSNFDTLPRWSFRNKLSLNVKKCYSLCDSLKILLRLLFIIFIVNPKP